jgi:hypothetical protein
MLSHSAYIHCPIRPYVRVFSISLGNEGGLASSKTLVNAREHVKRILSKILHRGYLYDNPTSILVKCWTWPNVLKRNTHARLVSSTFTFDHIRCRFYPSSHKVSHSSSSHYSRSSTGKHHHHIARDHLLTISIIITWMNEFQHPLEKNQCGPLG